MLQEEKFGVLEIPGEVHGEEDTSDAPTLIQPMKAWRKEETSEEEDWFLPF